MIDYKENIDGDFVLTLELEGDKEADRVIPNAEGNSDYKKMQKQIAEGEAQIVSYVPTAQAILDAAKLITDSKQYLRDTDWYVIRKQEKGTDIPAEITALRDQARIDANEV